MKKLLSFCGVGLVPMLLFAETYRPGLMQGRSHSRQDWSFTLADSEDPPEHTLGAVMANQQDRNRYTNPLTGNSFEWEDNTTFAYWGEIFLQGGVKLTVGKLLDDDGLIVINGNVILNNSNWNEFATGSYTPPVTGWYPIELRASDGNGGKGPYGDWSPNLGLGFNLIGQATATPKNNWSPFTVAADDFSLLRVQTEEDLVTLGEVTTDGESFTFPLSLVDGSATATVYLNGSMISTDDLSKWSVASDTISLTAGVTTSITLPWDGIGKPVCFVKANGSDMKGAFQSTFGPRSLSSYVVSGVYADARLEAINDAAVKGTLETLGEGATSASMELYYAPASQDFPADPLATLANVGVGAFSLPLENLQWDTPYKWLLVIENNLGDIQAFEGTFTAPKETGDAVPGLMQGQKKFPSEDRQAPDFTLRIADFPASKVDNTLGVLMGRPDAEANNQDDGRNKFVSDPNSREQWAWNEDYLYYYYEGKIFLEGEVPFYVVSKFDDGGAVFINNQEIFNQWTETPGGTGWTDGGNYHVGTFVPSATGWYDFRGYLWDWSGGKKRAWGVAGLQWTTDPNAVRQEGGRTYAKDNDGMHYNSSVWHPFYDDGTGSFLSIGTQPLNINFSTLVGDSLTASIGIPLVGPSTLQAWIGSTYGGDTATGWDRVVTLGPVDGDGNEDEVVTVSLQASERYIRFVAAPASGSDPSLAPTLIRANIGSESSEPSITLLPISGATAMSAVLPLNVNSFGAGATSCDAYAVYGLHQDALCYTNLLAEGITSTGRNNLSLEGLLPSRMYYVAVLCDNGSGEALSEVQPFTTAELDAAAYTSRTVEVTAWSVENGALNATLALGEDTSARDLYVAYGSTYGGTDLEAWGTVKPLGSMAFDATSYASNGDVTGVTNPTFVRFYLDCGDAGLSWAKTLVIGDTLAPNLGDAAVSNIRGDGALLSGSLLSCGDAPATVIAEVSLTSDFAEVVEWPVTETSTPSALSVDLYTADTESEKYIQPGTAYYARFVATSECGRVDATEPVFFESPAASELGKLSASVSLWTITLTGSLTTYGAGDGTTLTLLIGDSEETLEPVDSQVVTEEGEFSFTYEASAMGSPIFYQVVSSNACSTVTWTDETAVGNITPADRSTYYWKADVAEGDWTDPENWETDPADPRLTYPNSKECKVSFRNRGVGSATVVHVDGSYQCEQLAFGASNMTLTIKGTDAETSRLLLQGYLVENGSLYNRDGCQFTVDAAYVWSQDGYRTSTDSLLVVTNAATFSTGRDIWMSGDNGRLEAYGRSTIRVGNYSIQMNAPNTSILVDDSAVEIVNRYLELAQQAQAVSSSIEFRGQNPVLRCRGVSAGSSAAGCIPEIIFNIPVGGYTETPIQCIAGERQFMGADDNWPKQDLRIIAAKDSPFFQEGSTKTMQMVDWPNGIRTERILLDEQPRPSQTTFRYEYEENAAEGDLPIGIEVTAVGEARTLILFR